ncbi:hypothetical protein [Streptomyces sp. NPDC058451]|uniref:hypothetical protein n=1 Tax=Streptomyces sp. NPDC058451 TaxID=3346506 RepID=UPI00365E1037
MHVEVGNAGEFRDPVVSDRPWPSYIEPDARTEEQLRMLRAVQDQLRQQTRMARRRTGPPEDRRSYQDREDLIRRLLLIQGQLRQQIALAREQLGDPLDYAPPDWASDDTSKARLRPHLYPAVKQAVYEPSENYLPQVEPVDQPEAEPIEALSPDEKERLAWDTAATINQTLARLFLRLGPPPEGASGDFTPVPSGGGGGAEQ